MKMTDIYQAAIKGTLRSVRGVDGTLLAIVNDTPLTLDLFWIDYVGDHAGDSDVGWRVGYQGALLEANGGSMTLGCNPENYWLIKTRHSGAFVSVIEATTADRFVSLSGSDLLDPNDIGGIPEPSNSMIIPADGPAVLVGMGELPNGNIVTREQFWQRLPDSYSLAPGETRLVNFTISTGMQQSSSDTKTATESVSASASAGWGPFSASVSASLSKSSTSTHQVTVSTQQTSLVSTSYSNDGKAPVMFLNWQLADVITVFDKKGRSLASVVSGTTPTVVSGPFEVEEGSVHRREPETQQIAADGPTDLPRLLEVRPAVEAGR
ncbi:hypothetical protein ACFQ7J_05095 [Streptomyces sp. NPDC056501]|uniref:hypothetical protein n=1 Tax=Streptomyces sp. NPDC056501 TaxID=3345841 RepID=UPI0036C6B5A8